MDDEFQKKIHKWFFQCNFCLNVLVYIQQMNPIQSVCVFMVMFKNVRQNILYWFRWDNNVQMKVSFYIQHKHTKKCYYKFHISPKEIIMFFFAQEPMGRKILHYRNLISQNQVERGKKGGKSINEEFQILFAILLAIQ